MPTILYHGHLAPGEHARQRADAFARLPGWTVIEANIQPVPRGWIAQTLRAISWRMRRPFDLDHENATLLARALEHRPDIVFVDNSRLIRAATLATIRARTGALLVFLSPDDVFASHNQTAWLRETFPIWDLFFTTKTFNLSELNQAGAQHPVLIGNIYTATEHFPMTPEEVGAEFERFDAVFVGTHEHARADSIRLLAAAGLNIVVYGNDAGRTHGTWQSLRRHGVTVRPAVAAREHVRALHTGKIALGFLRKMNRDQITQRSIEIPAMARPMLAERTAEHDAHFENAVEYVGFTDDADMIARAKHLLADDEYRRSVAAAGHARCARSPYEMDDVIAQIRIEIDAAFDRRVHKVEPELQQSVLRRSARNLTSQVASFVVSMGDRIFLTAILLRVWGVAGFSDWTTIWATAGLLAMGEFGFQTFLGNLLTRAEVRGRTRAFQRIVALGVSFYLALGAALLAISLVLALGFDVRHALNLHQSGLALPFLLLCIYQILRVTRGCITQILRGKGHFHQLIWVDVRSMGLAILCAIGAVSLGGSPLLVAAIYLTIELLFGFVWSYFVVRARYTAVHVGIRRPSRREMLSMTSELRWYGSVQMVGYLMTNSPILILAFLGLNGPAIATFVVQRTLVNFSRTIAITMSMAFGVELAIERERGATRGYAEGAAALAKFNVVLAALATIGILLFGKDVIGVWTGRPELGSMTTLLLLLVPAVIVAPAAPLVMLTSYGSEPKPQAIANLIYVVLALPLCVGLGARFGVPGVAAGVAIGEVIGIGIVLPMLAAPLFGIAYRTLLRRCLLLLAVSVVWSSMVARVVTGIVPIETTLDLAIVLMLWMGIAGIPMFFVSLPGPVRARLMASARLYLRPARG